MVASIEIYKKEANTRDSLISGLQIELQDVHDTLKKRVRYLTFNFSLRLIMHLICSKSMQMKLMNLKLKRKKRKIS